ncbi:SRPBCC family protein [Prauserella oleivorans]|uniref:SRPBCC family protein n=1 Tax=Prauserella oleivorans TaxID=1478153 RepID=A0ABW5W6H1_9PSEU
MAEFEHQRRISADPALVFDVASGTDNLNAWSPEGVDLQPEGRDTVHAWVSSGSEVRDATGFVDVDREQRRLTWGGTHGENYTGWLQLEPDPAGGSLATMHLTFAGEQPEAAEGELGEEADRRIGEALDRLNALVMERSS